MTAFSALTAEFGPRLARDIYAPTEFAGNAAYRVDRVARAHGTTRRALEERAGHALPHAWFVIAGAPRARSLALGFPSARPIAPEARYPKGRTSRQLGLVAAHLGAALRLRATLAPPTSDAPQTEAVLTPDGDVLHTTPEAAPRRTSIADAVRRSERARRRGVSDDEALELWEALVDGRWTILDVEEHDGKRLILARRNDLGAGDVKALDARERDVAWLAAKGHSCKYIAYELGLSVSVVERVLAVAVAKLGFRSRRDLVRFFAEG